MTNQRIQTTKTVAALPMVASQLKVKLSNNNESQRITIPTLQERRVASPPSLTLTKIKHATLADRYRRDTPLHKVGMKTRRNQQSQGAAALFSQIITVFQGVWPVKSGAMN